MEVTAAGATMTLEVPAEPARRSGAQTIVETLESLGVRHIFGIPGGNVIPFYDALHAAASLRSILVRHEEGAVHAAHGYAIAGGDVGVCVATSGPGATNLITGIAEALADSAPVLILTGAVFSTLQGTDAFQDADIYGMTEGITKHSYRVTHPDDIAHTLITAHRIATSGRPGPVLVDITKDAQQGLVARQADANLGSGFDLEPTPTPAVLAQVARALAESERPVFVVGTGVLRSNAAAELRTLADRVGAGVITSSSAHGVIGDDDPHSIGVFGGRIATSALASCDVIVTVGLRPSVARSLVARVQVSSPIAQIDVDPSQLRSAPGILPITGDAKTTLVALAEHWSSSDPSPISWIAECRGAGGQRADQSSPEPFDADSALATISRSAHPDSMFVSEYPTANEWRPEALHVSAASRFFTSGGFVERGFAIPAALGAKFSRPERTVWAVTDSAGFQVSARELATSAVTGTPIKIVVLSRASDTQPIPNVTLLSESAGAVAMTASTASGLTHAIDLALRTIDRSVVLDLRIED